MFRCRAFNGSFWHFVVHDPSAVDIVAHINAGDKFRPRNNLVGANLDKTDGASDVCWAVSGFEIESVHRKCEREFEQRCGWQRGACFASFGLSF